MYNLGLMQLSIGVLIVWCFSCVHAQRAHTPPPPHCTSLKQVVNKLSGPDARLFQRCYTLLQNSLNRTTDDNGHTTQLPASSVPAVLSGALKSMNAVRCVVAHTHTWHPPQGCSHAPPPPSRFDKSPKAAPSAANDATCPSTSTLAPWCQMQHRLRRLSCSTRLQCLCLRRRDGACTHSCCCAC